MITMALERGLFDESELSSSKDLCFFRVETVISPNYTRSSFFDDMRFVTTLNAMAMNRDVPLSNTVAWCYLDEICPGTEMSKKFFESSLLFPVDILVCSEQNAKKKSEVLSSFRVVLRSESIPNVRALCDVIEAVSDGLR